MTPWELRLRGGNRLSATARERLKRMKAKLGMSPIAWWNDDLVELSDDVSLKSASGNRGRLGLPGWRRGGGFRMIRM